MRLLPLWLTALSLLWGCPPRPVERPRAMGFNRWDAKAALEARVGAHAAAPRLRAAARRDLGWLLLIHFGDAVRAEQQLALARKDAEVPMPWVWLGLATIYELRLDLDRAAAAYLAALEARQQLGRTPGKALPGPPLSLDELAIGAMARLVQQLPHLSQPVPDARLEALRPGLPSVALVTLELALLGRARLRGDQAVLRRRAREAGCPTRYTVSRHFGRFGRIELSHPFAPERLGVLSGSTQHTFRCGITVRSPSGYPGVRYVETVVQRKRAGKATVHVAWNHPFVLFVNGRKVFGPQDRFLPRPALHAIPISLQGGTNRLRFKLPVLDSQSRLQVLLTEPRRERPAGPRPTGTAARLLRAAYAPLQDALDLQRELHRGLADAGRPAAERLLKAAPRFTAGAGLRAELEQQDQLLGSRLGADRARAILAEALRSAPWAALLRLRLASLLRQQGKSKEALQLLRAVPEAGTPRLVQLARIRLYRDLDWKPLAARAARQLVRRYADWLPAWKLHYLLSHAENNARATAHAAERIHQLDATSIAWAQLLAQTGRHEQAVVEVGRLLPLRDDNRVLVLLASQLRLAGKSAVAVWQRLLDRSRWSSEYRIGLANELVAAGQHRAAVTTLRHGLQANPEETELRRALLALGTPDAMERFRTRGQDAIAAYRKAKWGAGRAPVYVLDRTVIRVFPSGGRLALTHQIVHLRSKEAIQTYAEVKLPPGVRVLTLRTIKADGTTRVPEELGEKDSVSLPDVEEGDLIEVEYVSAQRRQPFWPEGGFYGSTFSFRSLAAHFFHSELVLAAPKELPIRTSAWGAIPTPVRRQDGALLITRWTARRVPRLRPEPLLPYLAGVLPTVLLGSRVSWPDYLRQRQELAYDRDVASHGVRRLARRLCRDKPPREQARSLYAWVQKHVEESGHLYTPASETLARRAGSRLALLRSLLRQCRTGTVETRLLRPLGRELPSGEVPMVRLYSQPALWLRLGSGAFYLLPQLQQAPFGYLPPMLRKASAVAVERPEGHPTRTPDQPGADGRHTTLTVLLESDGSASILGHERLKGLLALQFRAALRRIPSRQLRQWLEQAFFGRFFVGATISRLTFKHGQDVDRPLEILYRLKVPRLAQVERSSKKLVLRSGFFPTQVGRLYARLSQRRLPLRLGPLGPLSLALTVQLPPGYRAAELPSPTRLQGPFGNFQLAVSSAPGRITIRRSLTVPFRIVPPTQYPAFTLFAAHIDRAEHLTIGLTK